MSNPRIVYSQNPDAWTVMVDDRHMGTFEREALAVQYADMLAGPLRWDCPRKYWCLYQEPSKQFGILFLGSFFSGQEAENQCPIHPDDRIGVFHEREMKNLNMVLNLWGNSLNPN